MDGPYDEDLLKGKELLEAADGVKALPFLESAYAKAPDDPKAMSYLGLAGAIERGQMSRGVDLCRAALQASPDDVQMYVNLAKVYLQAKHKRHAIQVIEAGLSVDPDASALWGLRRQLGIRRQPVLSFLPRRHVLNRWLGRTAAWLGLR